MGAWQQIGARLYFESVRCIGCGLCVTACRNDALELRPVASTPEPERGYARSIGKITPDLVTNAFRVWLKRTVLR
jgi:ferredoxin